MNSISKSPSVQARIALFGDHLGIFAACLMAATMTYSRSLFNIGALLLLVAWLLSGRFHRIGATVSSHPAIAMALVLFGMIAVSALYSPEAPPAAWRQVASYTDLLFIPLIAAFIDSQRNYRLFVAAAIFSLCVLLAAIHIHLFNHPNIRFNTGMYTSHIIEGFSLSILTLCSLAFARSQLRNQLPVTAIAVCIALVAGYTVFFINPGRGAQVALIVGLCVFGFLATPKGWRFITSGVLLMCGLFMVSQSDLMQARFTQAFAEIQSHETEKRTSVGLRLNAWKASVDLWSQSPIVGHGSKSYQLLMHTTQDATVGGCNNGRNPVCLQPHNQFFLFAVEQGGLGLALFIGLLAALAWPNVFKGKPPEPLAMAFALSFAAHAFFDSGLRMGYQSFTFVIITAVLIGRQILYLDPRASEQPKCNQQTSETT